MKNSRIYLIVIVCLICINIASISYFLFSGRSNGHLHHPLPIIEILDLSGGKAQKVAELERQHFKRKDLLMRNNHQLHLALFHVFCTESTNQKRKYLLIEKILSNQREMELMTFNYFQQIHQLCNKTEQKQLEKMMREVFSHAGGPPPKH